MSEFEPQSKFDASEILIKLDSEFLRRLVAGELRYDPQTESEVFSGMNKNGLSIKVRRPSVEMESRQQDLFKIRYVIDVRWPINQEPYRPEELVDYHLVMMEDGQVCQLDRNDVHGYLTDVSHINELLDFISF